ncbi:PREDICTED: uncharacterized protein LOC109177169 [Ipomoea nil]|uniref:uncharacterized protein LOC109177169 n=1 Tax=Ipomoea nil TaxID=35883 RepID=UPI000900878B|nr:PREDICTED: uncharacterized protein LOC109177169 [Ipomoea nil]
MAGRAVLEQGLARRIGDGTETRIWGWNWLADASNKPLITPCVDALRHATVSGLLDEHGRWDGDILRDIFHTDDIPRILATPVSTHTKDCWRWPGDLRGKYTVQNGYRLIVRERMHSTVAAAFHAWKTLWAAPTPPKVRNFLWRCARDVLLVRDNLRLKRVWIGGGCPICGFATESMAHLFCECDFAKQLWGTNDVLHGRGFISFMDHILGSQGADDALRVTWSAAYCQARSVVERARTREHWTSPPAGSLKCNVDASVAEGGASFGLVVRDHLGCFVAAKRGVLTDEHDPYVAEALAAKEALTWLKEQRLNNIILESDCLNFCNAFNSQSVDFSYVGLIVKQCRVIASDIGNVCIAHVRRSANRVAHELARATGSLAGSEVWFKIPPSCISDLLRF